MSIQQSINALTSAVSPEPGPASGKARAASAADTAVSPTQAVPQPSANLTSLGAQVRQLQTQLAQPGAGDFDAERVAAIRQAISNGEYQVNTGKIADGLIDSVRELLGRQTS